MGEQSYKESDTSLTTEWEKREDPHYYRLEKYMGVCKNCKFVAGYNEATRFFWYCPNCGFKAKEAPKF